MGEGDAQKGRQEGVGVVGDQVGEHGGSVVCWAAWRRVCSGSVAGPGRAGDGLAVGGRVEGDGEMRAVEPPGGAEVAGEDVACPHRKMDEYVEKVLIPEYTRGRVRKPNRVFKRTWEAMASARKRGDHAKVKELPKQLHSMPSINTQDPGYRRLRYVRYAVTRCSGLPDQR
ncbi:hypothetical protein GCM10010245_79110 [Streptomyces spectabilis]|nr:hypothetical protein GCM10010245_79110 [Streptomyces spectabilis]